MGDFSLHFLRHKQHTITGEFVERMFSHPPALPKITKPTRITSNTTSLIDNIFTDVK